MHGALGAGERVRGFAELMRAAEISDAAAEAFLMELVDLGAVCVEELSVADWGRLRAWAMLRPLQERRLRRALAGGE